MPPPDLRTPPPPPIRKDTSRPEDPNEPSFPTTLPPEVRNAIYGFAFVRDEPIVVIDAEEYKRRPAWECKDESEEVMRDEEDADLGYDADSPFKAHNIQLPTSFLRVCRQVYHEASGILYGKNTFRMSVALHRHNPAFRQLRTSVRWILCIGSQASLLAKVEIEAAARCPRICDTTKNYFCITRVIELAWARPELLGRIVFADSINLLDPRVPSHGSGRFPSKISCPSNPLNTLLHLFATKDQLAIKRYARFRGFITRIEIFDDLSAGGVTFASSTSLKNRGRAGFMLPFDILRKKKVLTLSWKSPQDAASMIMAPWTKPFNNIIERVISSTIPVTFDLDERRTQGMDLSLLSIGSIWRAYAIEVFQEKNDIGISFSTQEDRTSFANFKALGQWLNEPIYRLFPMNDHVDYPQDRAPSINMHFTKACRVSSLTSLEIAITTFLRMTIFMTKSTRVVCSLDLGTGDNSTDRFCKITLLELRRRCFVFLSWLIVRYPDLQTEECPQIWVDGKMRVLGTVGSPLLKNPDNPYERTSDTKLFGLGMQYVGIIENRCDPFVSRGRQINRLPNGDTLLAMWKSLRDRDWDWRSLDLMPVV